MNATTPSVEVILPVRDMTDQALACVDAVREQLLTGDRMTVVDDASRDLSLSAAATGAVRVIRLDAPLGPYGARHLAATRTTADVLVFVDARSRPRSGWLAAHRGLFGDESVALTCTGTTVARAPGFAPRVFRASNMFEIDSKIGVPGRLAFYPTANLGVRTSAYRAVGGFRSMRSGGDADLCWRIQAAGCGVFAAERASLMEWVPRRTVRELVEQWVRYGRSSAYLEAVYEREPVDVAAGASTRRNVAAAVRQTARQLTRTPLATTAQLALDALNVAVYERAKRRQPVPETPGFYELPADLGRTIEAAHR